MYSVIDFVNLATRKNSPGERPDKVLEYKPLMQALLHNNIPRSFIINKLLLPDHGASAYNGYYEPAKRKRWIKQRRFRQSPPYYPMHD
jgi:hypothetical protein